MQRYRNPLKPVEPYRPDFLKDFEPIDESIFGGLAWAGAALLLIVLVVMHILGIEL
jgi:hypothetical protein